MKKPMIAYLSPLPPKRTGIARYSHHLIKALQNSCKDTTIDVYDDGVDQSNDWQDDYQARELATLLFEKQSREQYRHFVYHFGNSPDFHFTLLQLLREQPGIVVLHDTVLFYLTTGHGGGELWQALCAEQKTCSLETLSTMHQCSPQHDIAQYPHPEHYPGIDEILNQATAVVVHSQLAKSRILDAGYTGVIYQVPLIDYHQPTLFEIDRVENKAIKKLYTQKCEDAVFIIGVFGFAGKTKRRQSIFQALLELPEAIKARIKLLIIGVDIYQDDVVEMGLSHLVLSTGYTSDDDYDQSMALCDLIINLRYPSMGETSAVQIQAMSAKKATIVSDHAWFAELSDDSVHKIAVGEGEIEALKLGIMRMLEDEDYRLSVAQSAQHYVREHHSPRVVAGQWLEILR